MTRKIVSLVLLTVMVLEPTVALGQTSPAATQDIGWPRQFTKDGATLTVYQPQLDGWKNYKELTARAAFALRPAGGQEILGVASVKADTMVDKNSRTVFLRDVKAESVRFPSLDPSAVDRM